MSQLKKVLRILPDPIYLRLVYYKNLKKLPDLKHPKTLNEKLQWLKLHDRRKEYSRMVDKVEAKGYVASIIGEEYIIPTLGVWDNVDDIDFDRLPNQFVMKCNHDSHGVIICRDKEKLDIEATREFFRNRLKINGFWYGREWPYKNVKPKILAEEYISDSTDGNDLNDYKFYCFGDYVDSVMVSIERATGNPKFYFFDRDWNLKRYNKRGKEAPADFSIPQPPNTDQMFNIAETLSKAVNAAFLRVDLYNVNGKIYFGELTLYPASGFDGNRLLETDLYFGSLVKLPIDQ